MAERLTRDLVLGAINRLLKVWVAETAPNHLSEGQRVSGEIEGDLRHESQLGGHWPEIVAWILGWDLPRTYTVVEELPSSAVFLAELGRRFSPLLGGGAQHPTAQFPGGLVARITPGSGLVVGVWVL